jgi:hypothetical protein
MPDSDLIPWLLAAETPTIRYRALVDLQKLPLDDPQVQAARNAIMAQGPAPAILSHQSESGAWRGENNYYQPKYRSTHWSMTLLAELEVGGADPRFQRGVEAMLALVGSYRASDLDSPYPRSVEYMLAALGSDMQRRRQSGRGGWSCLWGNMLRYIAHAGRLDDERQGAIVEYLVHDVMNDGCRCEYNYGYPCAWGVARALWGLAKLPETGRSPEVQQAIRSGVEFLLEAGRLAQADYPTPERASIHPLWFKLNFPLFYQTDILFTLRVLHESGALDHPGAQPAMDWLAQQRGKNGRWRGSSPYRQRTWKEMGAGEETDRWVSLWASIILAGR